MGRPRRDGDFVNCPLVDGFVIGNKKDGSSVGLKKISSLDKGVRARLPGADYYHCHLRTFRGVCVYERLGGNLQGIAPVFPNGSFSLPSPVFIIANLQ